MKLSMRLLLLMVASVAITALGVGLVMIHQLESTVLPVESARFQQRSRRLASVISDATLNARRDVLFMATTPPVEELGQSLANDPTSEQSQQQLGRIADLMKAQLETRPPYIQFRLISSKGKEVVRVDRSVETGNIQILTPDQLQEKGHRPYFREALRLDRGEVYISPVELNQEYGVVQTPYLPVTRVATPLFVDGDAVGIVIVNVDMRQALEALRTSALNEESIYLVNENGDFILHPNRDKEFGFDLGQRFTYQEELPHIAKALKNGTLTATVNDTQGNRHWVSAVPVTIEGERRLTLIDSLPYSELMLSVVQVRNAVLTGGIVAGLIAIAFAMAVARTLTRPLTRLTNAIDSFRKGSKLPPLPHSGDEIGVLSETFERMVKDVTAKAKALEEQAARDRLLSSIVNSTDDTILTKTLDGIITSWNPAAERLFGYAAEETIGKHISLIVPPERQKDITEILGRIRRGERVENFETIRVKKNGEIIHASITVSPLKSSTGEVVGASKILRDITERKRAEEALERQQKELQRSNAELEQFSFVASHDLQEPLRMVVSYSELLSDRYKGKLDDRADKYLKYIVEGGKRMQQLVTDLLEYSRVETRGKALKPTDSSSVLKMVLHDMENSMEALGGKVSVETSLPYVKADRTQLYQVFQNLIGNALKFRGDNPPVVEIGATQNGSTSIFYVRDNGIGIAPQHETRIFQMFQRLHGRDKYEGSGIGLAIVKRIIERHGGKVWFESQENKGTTFYFSIENA